MSWWLPLMFDEKISLKNVLSGTHRQIQRVMWVRKFEAGKFFDNKRTVRLLVLVRHGTVISSRNKIAPIGLISPETNQ